MGDASCNEGTCQRSVHARAMCKYHYESARVRGIFAPRPYREEAEEGFWRRVDASGDCWEWLAGLNNDGYGVFGKTDRHGRSAHAHRFAWQTLVGEVPDGLELDHLCRNRRCVNPDHLEPVTHAVNVQRSGRPRTLRCAVGHRIMAIKWENGKLICRRCRAADRRALKALQPPKPAPEPITHCKRGHEYTPENTKLQIGPTGRPKRSCRRCIVMHQRNYELRNGISNSRPKPRAT